MTGLCDLTDCKNPASYVDVGEAGDIYLCDAHRPSLCNLCSVPLDGRLHWRYCPLFKGTQ